jgi:hypothetical protein
MGAVTYNPRLTFPTRLLTKVVATGWFEKDEVAAALRVSVHMLDAYLSCETAIPTDRQLRLADFVVKKVQPLARMGYRLRGQASAALLYQSEQTATHMIAPVPPLR